MQKDVEIQLNQRVAGNEPDDEISASKTPSINDDAYLRRLGKQPLLNRSFGFMSILGFSCSSMVSWEGITVTCIGALVNGGTGGVIWGFLFNWIGTMCIFASIAELASIAPTAAGQYHWVAMMAPQRCKNFLTYLTAWVTVAAWQAMAASTGYVLSTIIQGMVVLSRPEYVPKAWHTILIMWATMLFAVAMNSTTGRALAKFEGLVLILHLMGFFGILIPLVYFGPHGENTIFTTFSNDGGWPSQALSFFIGLPSVATPLMGGDSAVHMSEEIQSAATVVPQALMYSITINGTLAWAIAIAMMFCMGDLEKAYEAAETMYYPFLEVFQQAVNSTVGASLMASIILAMSVASAVGVYASASRMLWSFSRDRGMPFHDQIIKLTKNQLPVVAIFTTLGISMVLSFMVLGSTVALNAFLSLQTAALYSSYFAVCALLLWRRLTGAFQPYQMDVSDIDPRRLMWGPWRVPEPWGTINNLFACLYLVFLWFWSFWPPVTPVTPQTTNWSVLMFGTLILFSVGWYAFRARKTFKGPIKEV